MDSKLNDLFQGLSSNDIKLDQYGRIVINRPDISAKIADALKPGRLDPLAEAGNGICCGNGSCLSDQLVSMLDRMTGGGRLGR